MFLTLTAGPAQSQTSQAGEPRAGTGHPLAATDWYAEQPLSRRIEMGRWVTANSLMELIAKSGDVYIMGHKMADMDAVGAALGVSCLCRKQGKKAYIVLDEENNASEKLIEIHHSSVIGAWLKSTALRPIM